MNRLGSEKDIVMLADYLITKNTYMTGRNISVDGGKSSRVKIHRLKITIRDREFEFGVPEK